MLQKGLAARLCFTVPFPEILRPLETEDFCPSTRQGYGLFWQSYAQSDTQHVTFGIKLPFGKDMPHFAKHSATATITDV
jgi:hypothetical protein